MTESGQGAQSRSGLCLILHTLLLLHNTKLAVCWLFCVTFTQAGIIWEQEQSAEKMPPPDWPVVFLLFPWLIIDMGEVQLTVGSATPGLVVLGALRKQADQAM